MRKAYLLLLFFPVLTAFLVPEDPSKTRVYLVGDSTMADKDSHKYPETGWGMPFRYFFDTTVVVLNRAVNGRSTKSFLAENRWQPILDSLREGDYVLIQFGHNDEAKEKKERYTSPQAFKDNLKRYIRDTRSRKAIPVILSPVARRRFLEDGSVAESHPVYATLAAEAAREEQALFIDLNEKSKALLNRFGPRTSALLFLQLEPGEHPNYPQGIQDNTHFSELGARCIAAIVLHEIGTLPTELARHIYQPPATKK